MNQNERKKKIKNRKHTSDEEGRGNMGDQIPGDGDQ